MFAVNIAGDDPFAPDEFMLVESTGTGQMPEYEIDEEGQNMVTALESAIVDFNYLFDDIKQTKGMNKRLAMEAHRLVPEMAERYPLGYFTEQPTQTLHRVALEELHAGIWAVIGAAALALTWAIWKFVSWIMGWGKPKDSEAPSSAEVKKGIEEAKVAATEDVERNRAEAPHQQAAATAIDEGVAAMGPHLPAIKASLAADKPEGAHEEVATFEDMMETLILRHGGTRYKALIDQSNNQWYDIMVGGKWTQTMLKLGNVLSALESVIEQRLKAMEQIFESDLTNGDPVKMATAKQHIQALAVPIPVSGVTGVGDLKGLLRALTADKEMMSVNTGKKKLAPVQASDRITRLINSPEFVRTLQARVKFMEQLGHIHDMETRMRMLAQKNQASPAQGVGQGVPHEVSNALAPVIHQLMADAGSLTVIEAHLMGFLDAVERFQMAVNGYWIVGENILRSYVNKMENPVPLPKEFDTAKAELGKIRAIAGKLPGLGFLRRKNLAKSS
jgi:hypothetical protein